MRSQIFSATFQDIFVVHFESSFFQIDLDIQANKTYPYAWTTFTVEEQDEQVDTTEDWTNLIDRGGRVHMKNDTYMLFHAMEVEVRRHLKRNITHVVKERMHLQR